EAPAHAQDLARGIRNTSKREQVSVFSRDQLLKQLVKSLLAIMIPTSMGRGNRGIRVYFRALKLLVIQPITTSNAAISFSNILPIDLHVRKHGWPIGAGSDDHIDIGIVRERRHQPTEHEPQIIGGWVPRHPPLQRAIQAMLHD